MQRVGNILMTAFVAAALSAPAVPAVAGVTVGSSTLFETLDYSDTFTYTDLGGIPGRGVGFPVGLPGINLEDNHGNPPQAWSDSRWSLNIDDNAYTGYPGGSGAGSASGMTQTGGGGDWGVDYGLRGQFVVQVDAVQTTDRIDVTAGGARDNIFDVSNISVFFRITGHESYPEIGLFNAVAGEHNTGLASGIASAAEWHNYAVAYDVPNRSLEVYVDEVSRGVIDLDTVAGGAFSGVALSNDVVSVGFAGSGRTDVGEPGHFNVGWTDNFQVGQLIPEPSVPVMAATGLVTLAFYLRRRRRY